MNKVLFEMKCCRWVGEDVMGNDDLVALILQYAPLTPQTFVAVSRVSKAWRSVCLRDEQVLMRALSRCKYITKGTVMGLVSPLAGYVRMLAGAVIFHTLTKSRQP